MRKKALTILLISFILSKYSKKRQKKGPLFPPPLAAFFYVLFSFYNLYIPLLFSYTFQNHKKKIQCVRLYIQQPVFWVQRRRYTMFELQKVVPLYHFLRGKIKPEPKKRGAYFSFAEPSTASGKQKRNPVV